MTFSGQRSIGGEVHEDKVDNVVYLKGLLPLANERNKGIAYELNLARYEIPFVAVVENGEANGCSSGSHCIAS
ncbi:MULTISPECIES: hypothetical protein [unclassified Rhizobium]|uniref:hypothetical protein n=1 Tax=unclassified Rhizobium TaxID=2613769 RepID=UPI001ADB5922|nr:MULTISPECIES: hypothetical protein [unclassified Rhizobium]MBO9126992.1 hypothetical protein [Rhizobium sp. 16-488-2b]MBO9177439.1 hypothetical protein [Rhizobium sp. 16-488-2a]